MASGAASTSFEFRFLSERERRSKEMDDVLRRERKLLHSYYPFYCCYVRTVEEGFRRKRKGDFSFPFQKQYAMPSHQKFGKEGLGEEEEKYHRA